MPCLRLPDGRSISGDLAIARYVARSSSSAVALLGGEDPVEAGVVDQWLDLSQTRVLAELASTLDAHLAPRYITKVQSTHCRQFAVWETTKTQICCFHVKIERFWGGRGEIAFAACGADPCNSFRS